MEILLTSNLKDVLRELDDIEKKVLPRATNSTINKMGKSANTIILKAVAKQAGLTQKDLKRRGFFSSIRSNFRTLTFSVIVGWGAIPLKDFNPRQTRKGVTAKAWGKRKLHEGAFVSEKLNRHVYKRVTKNRLPIEKLWGPIPARLAGNQEVDSKVNGMIQKRFIPTLDHEIKFYASRQFKRTSRGR